MLLASCTWGLLAALWKETNFRDLGELPEPLGQSPSSSWLQVGLKRGAEVAGDPARRKLRHRTERGL